jgi:hypothetical protein
VRYDRLKWLTSNETSRYIARGRGIDRRQDLSSLCGPEELWCP